MTVPPPIVALFTKGQETSFTVNRSPVDFPQVFNPEFAAYEAELVPQGYPGASAISSKPIVHPRLGQLLRIDFMKPGTPQGRDRRPRQLQLRLFSIPGEAFVYRITCVAPADEFAKRYEPIFTHMIDSLVITATSESEVSRRAVSDDATKLPESFGATIGPYEIISVLRRGPSATIYLAISPGSGREVALKVAADAIGQPRDDRNSENVSVAKRLVHRHIVRVLHEGTDAGLSVRGDGAVART